MGLGKLGDDATVTRSMSNLLTPLGLVPKRLYLRRKSGHSPHAHRDPIFYWSLVKAKASVESSVKLVMTKL